MKVKENIIKSLTIFTYIYLLLILIVIILDAFTPLDFTFAMKYAELVMFIFFSCCFLVIILCIIWKPKFLDREYNIRENKPKEFELKPNNFELFIIELEKIFQKNREKQYIYKEYNDYIMIVYLKKSIINPILTIIVKIKEELDYENLIKIKKDSLKITNDYLNSHKFVESMCYILVICVDEKNDVFDNFVNGAIRQTGAACILPVGISFADKKIYIATQTDPYMQLLHFISKRKIIKLLSNVIHR